MKPYFRLVAAIAVMAPVSLSAQQDAMPGWMTGAWAIKEGERWADEYWTPPRAGMMIGASRAGEGNKLKFWEHMRIVTEDDGILAFWAISGDQKPVRFAAVKSSHREIVFENATHDYPQRIRYWREGTELKAQISLIDGSKLNDFSLKMMSSP